MQKVVIPKGLVNPNETTIVEIPKDLQNVGTVVARPRKGGDTSLQQNKVPTYKRIKNPSQTLPRYKAAPYKGLHEGGLTFGGIPNESHLDMTPPPGVCPGAGGGAGGVSFQSPVAKSPPKARGGAYQNEISDDSLEYSSFFPFKESTKIRHGPPASSSPAPTYAAFSQRAQAPSGQSSFLGSPGRTPPPNRYYGEESGEEGGMCPCSDSSGGNLDSTGNTIQSGGSSGAYQRFDLSSSAQSSGSCPGGSYKQGFDVSGGSSGRQLSQRDVMNSLGELEATELCTIMGDLNRFQDARRRLVMDTSSLSTPADVSMNLLKM